MFAVPTARSSPALSSGRYRPARRLLLAIALAGLGSAAGAFELTWHDGSLNEEGFEIERRVQGPLPLPYELLATVGPDTTSYADSTAEPETDYCYRVRARNVLGPSAYSRVACTAPLVFRDFGQVAPSSIDNPAHRPAAPGVRTKTAPVPGLLALALLTLPSEPLGPSGDAGWALRFFGNGYGDIDRVKIRVDDPEGGGGPPADVGAGDFTVELWIRALEGENRASGLECGADDSWRRGNVILDRGRWLAEHGFGVSLDGGRIAWGADGADGVSRTICGSRRIDDGAWHHVAVDRRRADGRLSIWVDGWLDAQGDGPTGDLSYPDAAAPGDSSLDPERFGDPCGGPCLASDPFLVLGAEKHDAGPDHPSFSGWLDELRISSTVRYELEFPRPVAPFVTDGETVALYHFDEGDGDRVVDSSRAGGGPSHGERRPGGTPTGPAWVISDAPLSNSPRPPAAPTALTVRR